MLGVPHAIGRFSQSDWPSPYQSSRSPQNKNKASSTAQAGSGTSSNNNPSLSSRNVLSSIRVPFPSTAQTSVSSQISVQLATAPLSTLLATNQCQRQPPSKAPVILAARQRVATVPFLQLLLHPLTNSQNSTTSLPFPHLYLPSTTTKVPSLPASITVESWWRVALFLLYVHPRQNLMWVHIPLHSRKENLYLAGQTEAMPGAPQYTAFPPILHILSTRNLQVKVANRSMPPPIAHPEYLELRVHQHSALHKLHLHSALCPTRWSQSSPSHSNADLSLVPPPILPHPHLPLLPKPSPSPGLLRSGNALFCHRRSRVNFWYPMSDSKYTAVPVHRFQAHGAVLPQYPVHVAHFLSPAKVKRIKSQPIAPPHYRFAANDQPSRVSHPFLLHSCDINISTARSWSYDNFKTYPVMQLPPKKVKQMQKQIVDGEECEVEVEVEVVEKRKCLFKFAPSIQVSQWFPWLPLLAFYLRYRMASLLCYLQFNHHHRHTYHSIDRTIIIINH